MEEFEINGTSYEIPNLPRAVELRNLFESLDGTSQDTYKVRVARVMSDGSDYDNLDPRAKANYRGVLQGLIDEISTAQSVPSQSPAVARVGTQALISVLETRGDASRPHISSAISRLENIDLTSTYTGLDNQDRERIGDELGQILAFISSDTSETRREEISSAVNEVKALYDSYITERSSVNAEAENNRLIEEINNFEVWGDISSKNWAESGPEIISKITEQGMELTPENIELIRVFFENIKKMSEGLEANVTGVENFIDDAVSSLDNQPEIGPVSLELNQDGAVQSTYNFLASLIPPAYMQADPLGRAGVSVINFASKKEALQFLLSLKEILYEASSGTWFTNTDNFIIETVVTKGLSVLGMYNSLILTILTGAVSLYGYMISDGNLVFGSIMFGAGTLLGISQLRRFLSRLETGVSTDAMEKLITNIRANVDLYESAGLTQEAARLRSLLERIETINVESATGQRDNYTQVRQIYLELQDFQGSQVGDFLRTNIPGRIGYILDRPIRVGKGSGKFWTKLLRDVFIVYTAPAQVTTRVVNRGPEGGIAGWRLTTKSRILLLFSEAFQKSNKKFEAIFKVIDGIDFNPQMQAGIDNDVIRRELKQEILRAYRSEIGVTDPIRNTRFAANSEIRIPIQIPRIGVDSAIRIPTSISRVNIDRIAADILSTTINTYLGHDSNTHGMIRQVVGNAAEYERTRVSIGIVKETYSPFIEFHPEINDMHEAILKNILEIEGATATSEGDFKTRINRALGTILGGNTNFDNVKAFVEKSEGDRITTGSIKANIEKEAQRILNASDLEPSEKNERFERVRHFLTGNRTFWGPQISIVLKRILQGGSYDSRTDTILMTEIDSFLANGNLSEPVGYLRGYTYSQDINIHESQTGSSADPTTGKTETGPDAPETNNFRPASEFVGLNTDLGRGLEAFRLEMQMKSDNTINPDEFFAEILSENYKSRDALLAAMNEKLSAESVDMQVSPVSQNNLGRLQAEFLTYQRATAEDIYTRYQLSRGETVNERTIGAIQSHDNPMTLIRSSIANIAAIPGWESEELRGRITIDETTLSDLLTIRRGAWRNDGALRWRTILDGIRKGSS